MEDLAGGPMLRPPAIAPGGQQDTDSRVNRGSRARATWHQAQPFLEVRELAGLLCPAFSENK